MIKCSKKKEKKYTTGMEKHQEGISCSIEGMIGVDSEVTRGGDDDEDDEEFAWDVVLVVCKLVDLTVAD